MWCRRVTIRWVAGLWLACVFSVAPAGATEIVVNALMKGSAFLSVNGQQKLVKEGESFQGIKLLEADAREARILVNGEERRVGVSQRISATYTAPEKRQVMIPTNENRQYITTAQLNGRSTRVLVDTGANVIAMNSRVADSLGLDYRQERRHPVNTASGKVGSRPWSVASRSVLASAVSARAITRTPPALTSTQSPSFAPGASTPTPLTGSTACPAWTHPMKCARASLTS